MKPLSAIVLLVGIVGAGSGLAQEGPEIGTWSAPPYWTRPVATPAFEEGTLTSRLPKKAATAASSSPLPFVAITPCRQYDSRSGSVLVTGIPRTVTLIGAPCAISLDAEAGT